MTAHAFEIAVWRDQSDEGARPWGWTVRVRGVEIDSASTTQMRGSATEAFDAGSERLHQILRAGVEAAQRDLRLFEVLGARATVDKETTPR